LIFAAEMPSHLVKLSFGTSGDIKTIMNPPPLKPGIYAILDDATAAELMALCDRLLKLGVSAVQVRAKCLPPKARQELSCAVAQKFSSFWKTCPLIVNDDLPLARELGAGLHLGQEDLERTSIVLARDVLGPKALIGISTHTLSQAQAAFRKGASYLGFGPLLATRSKVNALAPRSLDEMASVIAAVSLPVVGIGGLNPENLASFRARGLRHAAMISAFHSPAYADRAFQKAIQELQG
jgi:thiamine-phosphate pyrophosphorylase